MLFELSKKNYRGVKLTPPPSRNRVNQICASTSDYNEMIMKKISMDKFLNRQLE